MELELLVALGELGDLLVAVVQLGLEGLLEGAVLILEVLLDSFEVLLGLLFADDGLTLAGLEGLDHAVVVALDLLALVLLLLDLHLHELDLLLRDGLVLLVLVLQTLVLFLELLEEVLELVDTLALLLRLLLLLGVELAQVRVVFGLHRLLVRQRAIQQLLSFGQVPPQLLLQVLALRLVQLQLLLGVGEAALALEQALV